MNFKIKTPTIIIDAKKAKANILRMKNRVHEAGGKFRPHFKTHQSADVAEWFRELGIDAITVSSITMARYFANRGWTDITIAFPFNINELDDLIELQKKSRITLIASSIETFSFLEKNLSEVTDVLIKIDVGAGRAGIPIENTDLIYELTCFFSKSRKLKLKGFLTHAGHTYHAKGLHEIQSISDKSYRSFQYLKQYIGNLSYMVSWGDTPSCSKANLTGYFDEWRPGNFVFYDVMQYHIGSCALEDIALAVACPVVEVHPERNQAIIYGGAIHFSKEFIAADNGFRLFGYVVKFNKDGWSDPVPGAWLMSVSQEHGIVQLSDNQTDMFKVGDIIGILPIHSCLTVSSLSEIRTLDGTKIQTMIQE